MLDLEQSNRDLREENEILREENLQLREALAPQSSSPHFGA